MQPHSMDRRAFLGKIGAVTAGLSYTLSVDAGSFEPLPWPVEPRDAEDIRVTLDSLNPLASIDARIACEPHLRLVELECDFLVAGGGMAGVCAALAAARNGASVVIIQDRSRLGGNASSEVRMHIVGADHHGSRPGRREGGIIEELRLQNAATNPEYCWELWDLLLYDKLVSEPNVRLLLDTTVCGADVEGGLIVRALARSDKTEHIYRITSKHYADCTGDCRLGLEAGATYRTGHETRETFGETLAPETAGDATLGSSILFTADNYSETRPFTPPAWARKITREHLKHRRISSWEYGYWWIEWGGQISAIHDNERIRFELLSIVLGVWDYIKKSGDLPESATWSLSWIGMIPGKRASRRLDGPHILTEQDCLGLNPPFPDAVAIGGWPFDNHAPTGFDNPEVPPYQSIKIESPYSIPLRSLYSANIQNLFIAGRNISASHVAFTSTRVMATCAVEGQAIGTAAAWCARNALLPSQLLLDPQALAAFRQALLRDDQTILGLKNEDPLDLARTAQVSASETVEGSDPKSVINGYVRDLPGEWQNRWGGYMDPGPAWLEFQWDAPQAISRIQITFDTGFERQLTLTAQASHQNR